MKRRAVLKLHALSSAFPALPTGVLAAFRSVHSSLPARPLFKALDPLMDATVTAIAELIIPQTDTPGAKAVRVNQFIDVILAEWYSDEDRAKFLAGLVDVDVRTQLGFGEKFVDVSPLQQDCILAQLGDGMVQAVTALASSPRGYRGVDPEPAGDEP